MRLKEENDKKIIIVEGLCETLIGELGYVDGQADAWFLYGARLSRILESILKEKKENGKEK